MYMCIPWTTAKLVQLSSIGENDESNLSITKNGKLISFLQKAISSLCKGHLPVDLVLYPLQLNPTSSHFLLLSFFFYLYIHISIYNQSPPVLFYIAFAIASSISFLSLCFLPYLHYYYSFIIIYYECLYDFILTLIIIKKKCKQNEYYGGLLCF